MTLQYILSGGHINLDKGVFTKELLLPDSPMKRLLRSGEIGVTRQPKVIKEEKSIIIDFNDASDIILDEGFYDLFKKLKEKYQEKLTGRVVIRITALSSYHVVLNLNDLGGKIVYE